jgi:signal transduction histidine kinase
MKAEATYTEIVSVIEPFLRKERGHTDRSLTHERGQTDESLFVLRKKAEQEADATVDTGRKQADKTKAQLRSDSDSKSVADEGTVNERNAADKAVRSERCKVDAAIKNERVQKDKVLTAFFQRERLDTDTSLSHERSQTDLAVSNSTKLLSDEVGFHKRTRAELTTRDELLAIVSHDLRNPIGSVLSCADMLLEDADQAGMSTDLKNWIQLIKRNAETSLRLIRDILDMECIAEGKLTLEVAPQGVLKVLREAIEPFVQVASANRILLRVAPGVKDTVALFDKDRIAQVLSNLIGNALKFTPDGGSITLCVKEEGEEAFIMLEDSGIGVPDEQKERIFARHVQIGNKDRRGLGLGLYISKMLIESHHGRLWVTDAPVKGSIFHFSLPLGTAVVLG